MLRFLRFGAKGISNRNLKARQSQSHAQQVIVRMLIQDGTQRHIQPTTAAGAAVTRAVRAVTFNPLQVWRGFFVDYSFYFGFFGYRQTPARAGATRMPV